MQRNQNIFIVDINDTIADNKLTHQDSPQNVSEVIFEILIIIM